jgi:type I restriction enzyme S subunit
MDTTKTPRHKEDMGKRPASSVSSCLGGSKPLPPGWRWVKLGEVTKVYNGTTPTSEAAYWNGGIVWVTPSDLGKLDGIHILSSARSVSPLAVASFNLSLVPPGTVVLSSRAPIGHLGIAGVELCTNQGCKSFVPSDGIDSVFLYFALKSSVADLQRLGSGATFAEVSKSQCENFEIPLPPLSEQRRIAGVLREQMTAVERARAAARARLEAVKALPAAFLRQVFP